jgi:hypothetical protein
LDQLEGSDRWVVKLSFTANDIEHDARWSFEPKKQALAPLNSEAVTLSKQGELPQHGLIPRLRAVERDDSRPDDSRFDSGAFNFRENSDDSLDLSPTIDIAAIGRPQASSKAAAAAAINRAQDAGSSTQSNQTADLLEALRKRRGERESAHTDEAHTETAQAPRLVESPMAEHKEDAPTPPAEVPVTSSRGSSKRGRTAMPSWDEIVFGARTDED